MSVERWEMLLCEDCCLFRTGMGKFRGVGTFVKIHLNANLIKVVTNKMIYITQNHTFILPFGCVYHVCGP